MTPLVLAELAELRVQRNLKQTWKCYIHRFLLLRTSNAVFGWTDRTGRNVTTVVKYKQMQIQSNVTLIFFLIISNVLRGYANNIYLTDGFHGYTRQMLNMNIRECLYMCKIRFPCLRRFHLRQPPRLNLHICCHSLIACTYPCPSNHLPCNCR